jgi:hypothetical protein
MRSVQELITWKIYPPGLYYVFKTKNQGCQVNGGPAWCYLGVGWLNVVGVVFFLYSVYVMVQDSPPTQSKNKPHTKCLNSEEDFNKPKQTIEYSVALVEYLGKSLESDTCSRRKHEIKKSFIISFSIIVNSAFR